MPWSRYTMPDEESAKELVRRAKEKLGITVTTRETPFGTYEALLEEKDVEAVSWIALDILLPGSDVYKERAESALDRFITSCFRGE